MSNSAVIRGRRRLADGRRLVNVVCPRCEHRHWLPDTATGYCPRRHTAFTITPVEVNTSD
jgi:hypothetical protein